MDHDLAYDISVHQDTAALADEPLNLDGLPGGAMMRRLRDLRDGAVRSALVTLPQGWTSGGPLRSATVQQIFVLSGALRIGDARIGPQGFAVVKAGAVMGELVAEDEAQAILILDGPQTYSPAAEADGEGVLVVEDAFAIEPITPVIHGRRLEGFERRVLWLDEQTGADTRLLRVPGGFKGGGPNWHPVHEEIFCIEGDIAPDDTRLMSAGHYLWNPAYGVHGFHEHSREGCLVVEWHDGAWALNPYTP
jgi:hypothetical protein